MVVSTFFMLNKDGRERFFEESFLLADVNLDVVFVMLFLTINNADVDFQAWDLQWRSYNTRNILPNTSRVELIGKKEFATAALDLKHQVFVVHVAVQSIDLGNEMHPLKKA